MVATNRFTTAEKVLTRFKGLRDHLQPGEEPLSTMPGIWDGEQGKRSEPCEVILTNQRIIGYYLAKFPRERLFFDALTLAKIAAVSFREKSHEPIFRELLIREEQRKVYIRAPRKKLEALYAELRAAIEQYVPSASATLESDAESGSEQQAPIYGHQEIRGTFEKSLLAISILFVGGLILEIIGAILWAFTHSMQAGFPPFLAGLVAVFTAFMLRKQRG